jgi:protein TonB
MRQLLLGLFFLSTAFVSQAQQVTHPAYPYKEIKYFDEIGTELPTPLGSAYWLQTTYIDSVSGVVRRCYPSGKLKEYIPYASLRDRIVYGVVTSWYKDGQMQTKEEYILGRRQGQMLVYYPNGALQRKEVYEAGHSMPGASCFGPNGQPVPCEPYEQRPLYPGGEARLMKDVLHQVHIPYLDFYIEQNGFAIPRGYELFGGLKVAFTVATDGTVKDITVTDDIVKDVEIAVGKVIKVTGSPVQVAVDKKVIAAVQSLHRFMPGRRNGSLVETRLEMHVLFNMPNVSISAPARPAHL